MNPLRVCLDARITGEAGGVQQFVIGLAHGLSQLSDGDEEYWFLAYHGQDEWLRPFVTGRCRILPLPARPPAPSWRRMAGAVKRRLGAIPPTGLWRELPARLFPPLVPQRSDGTIERAGAAIMHFTFQGAFCTDVPSIYHPHDLQHLHLPQFFSAWERRDREIAYRMFCQQARLVAVSSEWTRRDVLARYALPDEVVQVVPLAPPIAAYPMPSDHDLRVAREKFQLPEAFLLYPAQTWPHKNHLGLLAALRMLRVHRGLAPALVCCGRQNGFFRTIERHVRHLGLQQQVRFLGFVTPMELQCLYRLCAAVVIPTLFEAGSFPLWEAFLAGAPAACSNATSLPEQAGDAAVLFDPTRPGEMAEAVARVWTDPVLRTRLAAQGRACVERLTWERTARCFRAHYRRIAGRSLTAEDEAVLTA